MPRAVGPMTGYHKKPALPLACGITPLLTPVVHFHTGIDLFLDQWDTLRA